ncbi:MAG: NlpC/P60 family protein [Bacteroidia bacterium]
MYGICHLSLVPCRKEPSDRSEMVTQLLFGEHFTILETAEKWSRIRIAFDEYECWIDNKQFLPLKINSYNTLQTANPIYSTELVHFLSAPDGSALPILLGSTLPGFSTNKCFIENKEWGYEGQSLVSGTRTERSRLIETALLYLGAPYLWGGRSPFGIDCSGFTQMVFKLNSKKILRDAWQQSEQGQLLSFPEEAEAGDLAFFDNSEGKIIHTGIILSSNRIIHASGQVRIDRFDHQGIFNTGTGKYSHNLRMLRKLV